MIKQLTEKACEGINEAAEAFTSTNGFPTQAFVAFKAGALEGTEIAMGQAYQLFGALFFQVDKNLSAEWVEWGDKVLDYLSNAEYTDNPPQHPALTTKKEGE